ncbi:MAG: 6-phosphofructokinase [Candidatus Auribacterota bacterium]|jgi:6-phosphofructokinase 1|nr:6-phosphofructokinase [Candidatus Auribacterota bacterium]
MSPVKGNALIGQSGGPTCVINQSLVGVIEEVHKTPSIENLYGAVHGVQGILNENLIDLMKESWDTLERVAITPSAALGSVRKKVTREECEQIFKIFQKHNIRYFYYIGGNDSAETANIINELAQESKFELRVFHIPKTIDNDLLETDHCPGYGSAARFVTLAFMGDNYDNRSLPGIKINVVMGRHAGFLTAASRAARIDPDDAPHLIYVPERVFTKEQFLDDVQKVLDRLGRAVISVSEGIHGPSGEPVFSTGEVDSHGNVQLSGTGALGDFLSGLIKNNLGKKLRVRSDTFGYLQRSFPGCVSEVDSYEARMAGRNAVRYSLQEDWDGSVIFRRTANGKDYKCVTEIVPLKKLAKNTKSLEDQYINLAGNDIKEEYLDYVLPLMGELPKTGKFVGYKL